MKKHIIGFDIGGTKCAVVIGKYDAAAEEIAVIGKRRYATADCPAPLECLEQLCRLAEELCGELKIDRASLRGVGISCGGPLDARSGVILCPPNLPGWVNIPAVDIVSKRMGLPTRLENDANACAIAEWKFGAGRGTQDMVFLTFGTGMGGGIIANGQLLGGRNSLGGECGHIRIAPDGPVGFGKAGSFEGFCSGGGIGRIGRAYAKEALAQGRRLPWCASEAELEGVTAKSIAEAAFAGDEDAKRIYAETGRHLGEGLSYLIDILNPECIVIGSVFARAEALLRPAMEEAIAREAIPESAAVCRVVPAKLGEAIGDIAALSLMI